MKWVKFGFWALVGLCLIVVALANAQMIQVRALPGALADLLGVSPVISLPLYAVIFFGVAFGLLVGFVWEWIREYKERAALRRREAQVAHLEAEVARLKREKHNSDDIIALIDDNAA